MHVVLSDNGDDDGWADSNETVQMRLRVHNATRTDLTGVTAFLSTDAPEIECLTTAWLDIGGLLAGETRTTAGAFELKVADVDRASLDQDLSATFTVVFSSDQLGYPMANPQGVTLELDLDVAGGTGATTFFESFESGFGTFTTMHLDESLNPPDSDLGNREAGVANADGFRCQYSDPDWEGSTSFDSTQAQHCFPNATDAPDAFYFETTVDRAFEGAASMHFGLFLDEARGTTTPTGQLEAIATVDPVNLAWERVCSIAGVACTEDGSCPAGESCVPAASTLSFKHQVRFLDHRVISASPYRSVDRGIVQVQRADASGQPVGPWIKLHPYVNVYDSPANAHYTNCYFDPIDDGNTEQDFFDPTDPFRRLGPSSTCYPELNFADQGLTYGEFDPEGLGDASDGPGLAGEAGAGTWVEPRFDLGRFRGQRLRLRLLATGIKLSKVVHWEQVINFNPSPEDDGWFVDDVTVTRALIQPATVSVDSADNGGLPGLEDLDGDGVLCDNCPADFNPDQRNADGDPFGDDCDPCVFEAPNDADGDGWCCPDDNCCEQANPLQGDLDGDSVGDLCDNCSGVPNPDQADFRGDGIGEACDDPDGDGEPDATDNCRDVPNDQTDTDGDGQGDACDVCPESALASNGDRDGDGFGDVCDSCPADANVGDQDVDGVDDACDNCPTSSNPQQGDTDRDGIGNACDNCPRLASPPQTDTDGDGQGDACDRCPEGSWLDTDGDGIPCLMDTCPEIADPDQTDTDRDGEGDPCDPCPFDAANDFDGDETCGDEDNCPTRLNPDQWANVRLSGDLPPFGGVSSIYRFTADGFRVIYRADHDNSNAEELYSVTVSGSGSPIKLNAPLLSPFHPVSRFTAPQSGSTVVYTAASQLYAVPADGSAPALNLTAWQFFTRDYEVSTDGAWVVFTDSPSDPDTDELFGVPVDGSLPVVKISGALTPGGTVIDWRITPDGQRVVFIADADVDERDELYSVPVEGGERIRLNGDLGPGGTVVSFSRSRDGAWIAYRANEQDGSLLDLYIAPTTEGGQSARRTTDGAVFDYRFDPLSQRILYRRHPQSAELFQVPVAGGSPVLLSDNAVSYTFAPDGSEILFYGNPDEQGTVNLYGMPVAGGPIRSLTALPPGAAVSGFRINPEGTHVVYYADPFEPGRQELFSIPYGGGEPVQISGPTVPDGDVEFATIAAGEQWVVFKGDLRLDRARELYRARLDGSFVEPLAREPRLGGNTSSPSFQITPDGSTVVYRDNQLSASVEELFAARLDPDVDGDGILGFCDCDDAEPAVYPLAPEVNDGLDNQCAADPGFGQIDELDTLSGFQHPDPNVFGWTAQPGATAYQVARATLPAFTTACTAASTAESAWIDPEQPRSGVTFFYLARSFAPFPGSWGVDSAGQPRTVPCE